MTVWVTDAHAHVYRLVSVIKMATVLQECTTEEQRSVVCFCWRKDSMQRIFIKKCFLFTVGSVCRVKRFTAGWQTFSWWWRGWNGGAEVAETTVKRLLCCGFRRTNKAMGHMYQSWWRICREIHFFRVRISHVLRFISICDLFTDSPFYIHNLAAQKFAPV
jgi:hypothetical protein